MRDSPKTKRESAVYLPFLTKLILDYKLTKGDIPKKPKIPDVFPAYKKIDSLEKENYTLTNLLPRLCKVFS